MAAFILIWLNFNLQMPEYPDWRFRASDYILKIKS